MFDPESGAFPAGEHCDPGLTKKELMYLVAWHGLIASRVSDEADFIARRASTLVGEAINELKGGGEGLSQVTL